MPKFVAVGIHTSPEKAVEEISALADVFDGVKRSLGLDNVLIMGDFNAGCDYVKYESWPRIKLATDKRFIWLISNSADTTTKGTDCPYDRLVVAGSELVQAVIPRSPGVFYFDEEYNLSQDAVSFSAFFPLYVYMLSSLSR